MMMDGKDDKYDSENNRWWRVMEKWQDWQRMIWKVTCILAYNSIFPLGPNPEVHAQNSWDIKDD